MRSQQFGLPIFFTWKVAHRGYRWIDYKGGRWLCAIDALARPDFVFDQYQTQQPLLERSGLFRELAELQPREPEILDFVNNFGLLTEGQSLSVNTEFGRMPVQGESLQFWQDEVHALKLTVSLWNTVSTGGNQLATELKAALAKLELPIFVQRALHLTDDDPLMTALSLIQRQTDAHLRADVDSRLVFSGGQPRLHLRLQPTTLLGALWLQFALAIDLLKRFVKCAECGSPFEVSHAAKLPENARTRSFAVHAAASVIYRGRIEQAQRLRLSLPPKEIARRLNTSLGVINRWLAAGKTKKARSAPLDPWSASARSSFQCQRGCANRWLCSVPGFPVVPSFVRRELMVF